ncbi:MAG: adenylate/guanylate cyclase domain-containing protein, partial [Planctomycetota bacterium]|nr:adenylate/guanylate cyclase domain-containing protein [Planctomycetota bacterium]
MKCPKCNSEVPDTARFCSECAAPLRVPEPLPLRENRIATVLFSDLSGFTSMTEQLGHEETAELTADLFRRFEPIIESYNGHLDKYIGDAVMALFGAPTAHEDDPVRAILCALEMQDALASFNRHHGTQMAMRIGINTGEVAAGKPTEKGGYTVVGDAVNVAQRLESKASPGRVLVGLATQKLAQHRFTFRELPPTAVKGRREPVQPFEVVAPRDVKSLLEQRTGPTTAMVGRDDELQRLKELFDDALTHSRCRCAIVTGEAGVGKSRLVYEFHQWLADDPRAVKILRGRCLPYAAPPLGPFREIFRGCYDIRAGMAAHLCRETLARCISEEMSDLVAAGRVKAGTELENLTHLVGLAIGIDFPEARIMALPIDRRREECFYALTMLVEAMARRSLSGNRNAAVPATDSRIGSMSPLLIDIEDMHWADEETAALLVHLLERLVDLPVFFLISARDEIERRPFGERLMSRADITRVRLKELGKDRIAELLERLMGAPVEDSLLADLIGRTAGNPYFVEEIARYIMEKGLAAQEDGKWRLHALPAHSPATGGTRRIAGQPTASSSGDKGATKGTRVMPVIPDSLEGLLGARIDGLESREREAIRRASVIGRVFWEGAVEELAMRSVTAEFAALKAAGFIFLQRGSMLQQEMEYIFKHMLLRDAAYRRLTKKEKQELHGKVARWMEERLGGAPGELVQLAAYHNAEAGLLDNALAHWEKAGDIALEAAMLDGAVGCCKEGIHIIEEMSGEEQGTRRSGDQKIGGSGDREIRDGRPREDEAPAGPGTVIPAQAGIQASMASSAHRDERALALSRRKAALMEKCAEALALKGDTQEAIDSLETALTLTDEPGTKARLLRKLGGHRHIQGKVEEAKALYASALGYVADKAVPEEVRVLLALGWLEGDAVGNFVEAERLARKAMQITENMPEAKSAGKADRERLHAMCRRNLGVFAHGRGDLPAAERILAEVLVHYEARGDRGGVGAVSITLGNVYSAKGELDRALEFHNKYLEISEQIGNRRGVGMVSNNIGNVYLARGELDLALEFFSRHHEISKQVDDRRGVG